MRRTAKLAIGISALVVGVALTACGSLGASPVADTGTSTPEGGATAAQPAAPAVAPTTPPARPAASCLATWQPPLDTSGDTVEDSTITLSNPTPNVITVNGVDVSYSSGGYQVGSEQVNPVNGTEGTGGITMPPGSQAKVTMGADIVYLNGNWGPVCSVIDIYWQNGG
jgi:hypothetical protein